MISSSFEVTAGPCSINELSERELIELASLEVEGKKVISNFRAVGLKSRTENDSTGKGMGMDYEVVRHNMQVLARSGSTAGFDMLPSMELAAKIIAQTNMIAASEIMVASVQLPMALQALPKGMFRPWNPSVDQLGWHEMEMAAYAEQGNWDIMLKNGKWLGESLEDLRDLDKLTGVEKSWHGLATYAGDVSGHVMFINRGIDIPQKGDYRNLPVHEMAMKAKLFTGKKVLYDPSHTNGPKRRDQIVDDMIFVAGLKMPDTEEFVYDGVMVECLTSETDTLQHITLPELHYALNRISEIRDLATRE
jgi:hypothetical protein